MSIIKVNQVQDTSTNVAANISGGVVSLTTPLASSSGGTGHSALIAFDVSKIKTTGSTFGSNQVQIFNHITTNIGNTYDSSNGRFTAPVAGTYEFTHLAMGASNTSGSSLSSGQTVQMFFRKNGSVTDTTKYGRIYSHVATTNYPNISTSIILTLAQNDYIEVYYDAFYMYFDTSIFNNFTGKLIGVA